MALECKPANSIDMKFEIKDKDTNKILEEQSRGSSEYSVCMIKLSKTIVLNKTSEGMQLNLNKYYE